MKTIYFFNRYNELLYKSNPTFIPRIGENVKIRGFMYIVKSVVHDIDNDSIHITLQ